MGPLRPPLRRATRTSPASCSGRVSRGIRCARTSRSKEEGGERRGVSDGRRFPSLIPSLSPTERSRRTLRPPPAAEALPGEEIELGFGPQHPAIQGVLRLKVRVDGERIVRLPARARPSPPGDREALRAAQPYAANVPQTDHLDFAAAATSNLAYVGAVEKLLGIVAPPRARYLRTIFAELQRIASHLLWLGTHAADVGVMPPFFAALATATGPRPLRASTSGSYPGAQRHAPRRALPRSAGGLGGEVPRARWRACPGPARRARGAPHREPALEEADGGARRARGRERPSISG